jgi:thioredoxin-related protein
MNNNNIKSFRSAILIILFFAFAQQAAAFQSKVHFQNITFKKAKKLAKKQKKFIYIDVINGDLNSKAKKMREKIFSKPKIASYFNKHFINVRLNMRSEKGKSFAPKLQMLMYPTTIFFAYREIQLNVVRLGGVANNPDSLLDIAHKAYKEGKFLAQTATSKTQFKINPTYATLLAKSKKEHKPIVLDFYTTWCRPCIQMDRRIFTQNKVSSLYNKGFILAQYNAEKGQGTHLSKKYKVWAYPTYVFLNSDGKQIKRVEGYTKAKGMIDAAQKALNSFKKENK